MANSARLVVNNVEVVWDEDERRSAKACVCRELTQGRMKVKRDGKTTTTPVCLKCSARLLAETAFAPVGEAVRAIRKAVQG